MTMFETERLYLRNWQKSDKLPFAKLNADKEVMHYFPKTLTMDESNAMITRLQTFIDNNGYGLWAVEYKRTGDFIGFIGLNVPKLELPFSPCVEIGWRLDKAYWGQGLAVEGASACLDFAFNQLNLDSVVSFTAILNKNSQRVMQKLAMVLDGEFDYPTIDEHSVLKRHCVYRINKQAWNLTRNSL